MTDLQQTGLTFGRLKIGFCLHLVASLLQDGYPDAVTQGHTSPLSSHGSCKPIDEYPYCTEGAMQWGNEAGVTAANGATSLVAFCWLTP